MVLPPPGFHRGPQARLPPADVDFLHWREAGVGDGWVSNKKNLQDYIMSNLMSADESWSGKLMIDVLTCYQAMTGRE